MQNQLTCNQVWTQDTLVLSISGLTDTLAVTGHSLRNSCVHNVALL